MRICFGMGLSASLNGVELSDSIDTFGPRVALAEMLDFGEFNLEAGQQLLAFKFKDARRHCRK